MIHFESDSEEAARAAVSKDARPLIQRSREYFSVIPVTDPEPDSRGSRPGMTTSEDSSIKFAAQTFGTGG